MYQILNNRVVTATGGTTANAEANLTFDGSQLNLAGDMQFTAANPELIIMVVQDLEFSSKYINYSHWWSIGFNK